LPLSQLPRTGDHAEQPKASTEQKSPHPLHRSPAYSATQSPLGERISNDGSNARKAASRPQIRSDRRTRDFSTAAELQST
jgi:hypothetical protein